eukprot:6880751-Prymnesium_polylepis.1
MFIVTVPTSSSTHVNSAKTAAADELPGSYRSKKIFSRHERRSLWSRLTSSFADSSEWAVRPSEQTSLSSREKRTVLCKSLVRRFSLFAATTTLVPALQDKRPFGPPPAEKSTLIWAKE